MKNRSKNTYFPNLQVDTKLKLEYRPFDGIIDAVIKTDDTIFVLEFKINQSPKTAIQHISTMLNARIRDKKYALKYADDKRAVILLGINFDTTKKLIEDYLAEDY